MSESKRGCGYRKIGGLYLVSDSGAQIMCDGLPLELRPCQCCGFEPSFSRNLQRINAYYLELMEGKHHMENRNVCKCFNDCPLCHPDPEATYGLMFVGKQSYTPESFIKEAINMGVSKRIPEIPSWLILGKTWVFLAHIKTPKVSLEKLKENGLHEKEPEYVRAIFYGFQPRRVEMPVWRGDLSDVEGITPVLLDKTPENLKRHKNAKAMKKTLSKLLDAVSQEKQKGEDEYQ